MTIVLLAAIVFAGAFVQAASGVGFGVVAGPCLLHLHGYERAMTETAAFSVVVALATLLAAPVRIDRRAAASLVAGLPPGVAAGLFVAACLPRTAVVGGFGVMLLALGLSLLRRGSTRPGSAPGSTATIATAAVTAGAGAYLFAAPGPPAAWGLARAGLPPPAIRSTLAAYFVAAYSAVLVAFAATGRLGAADWEDLVLTAPAALAGTAAGMLCGTRLSAPALRTAIGVVVAGSGGSILATAAWGGMR